MDAPEYSLPLSHDEGVARSRRWLLLGTLSLGVAGIFAGLLANSKSAFFYTALVVHVDLSVLVWFLTIACMFFSLACAGKGSRMLASTSFYCFASGAALIVLSAFTGGVPYMSNYIPVIHHPLFFFALSLLLCGVLGEMVNLVFSFRRQSLMSASYIGVISAAVITFTAILCFVWSVRTLPADLSGQTYYEYAFWGGGHVLQFTHTQLMLVAWVWLAGAAGIESTLKHKLMVRLYAFGLFAALVSIVIYFRHEVISDEHRSAFTDLMRHANGLTPLAAGVLLTLGIVTTRRTKIEPLPYICLIMSLLLFAAGGVLGYMIAGSNVTVPAHYHGSIVGVTLAFMGVAYLLLPAFGYADVSENKLARLQPIIYGGGQLCWMAGMAILGAHGVTRKTPGSADTMGALAAFLKHGGDSLALIGGLLFVFVVLRAIYQSRRKVA